MTPPSIKGPGTPQATGNVTGVDASSAPVQAKPAANVKQLNFEALASAAEGDRKKHVASICSAMGLEGPALADATDAIHKALQEHIRFSKPGYDQALANVAKA